MASALKSRLLGNGDVDSKDAKREAEKYRLTVTAGPSYDTSLHKPVLVNTDSATCIENEFMRAKIKVRIRGYQGLPSSCPPDSPYFNDPMHTKDQYSVAFSFVPKQDLPSTDTVWGNDFDHPIRDRLPPGFNTAFRIVKEFIDPGLQCDAYADEPWLYGPSLSCWFAFRIGDKIDEKQDFAAPSEEDVMTEGADGDEATEIRKGLGLPDSSEKRRKFFLDASNRERFTFEKGRIYQGDFYNPYLDFGKLAVKLPGFSLGVVKYIDGKTHCLRYVFKNRETGDLYFNVNMRLLFGDELQRATKDDQLGHQDSITSSQSQESSAYNPMVSGHSSGSSKAETAGSEPDDEESVNEIVELLQNTATKDLRQSKANIL